MWFNKVLNSDPNPTACVHNNNPKESEANGDLNNWDYLTKVFDHEDYFEEHRRAPQSPIQHKETIGHYPSDEQRSSRTFTAAQTTTPRKQTQSSLISANVIIDTSNPEALFLPVQNFSYIQPDSNERMTVVLGPTVLHCSSPFQRMQQQQPFMQDMKNQRASLGMSRCHPATVNWSYSVDNSMDLEPITLPFGRMVNRMQQTNLPLQQHDEFGVSRASSVVVGVSQERLNQDLYARQKESALKHRRRNVDVNNLALASKMSANMPTTTLQDEETLQSSKDDASMQVPPVTTYSSALPSPQTICKPLTAYNYFYRDERDNIVQGLKNHGDPLPTPVCDFSQRKQQILLEQHWYVDPVKGKRQHRKVHGKIEFPKLSKVIAHRWRSLPASGREFYRRVARADIEQYDRFLAAQGRTQRAGPKETKGKKDDNELN